MSKKEKASSFAKGGAERRKRQNFTNIAFGDQIFLRIYYHAGKIIFYRDS
jgi:hypothetical protein